MLLINTCALMRILLLSFVFSDMSSKFAGAEYHPKVVVTHSDFPNVGFQYLNKNCNVTVIDGSNRREMLKMVKGAEGILWATQDPLNSEVLDSAGPQLKSISTMTAGLNYVDVHEIKKRGIALGYTPIIVNDAVAELAISLAISAARRTHEGRLQIEKSQWEMRPQWMLGMEIKGSTIGIVGLGGIGQSIVKRLSGFEVSQIIYTGHGEKSDGAKIGAKFVSFDQLLRESDFIFIACPLTSETNHMFNTDAFSKMKSTSVLVNIARGAIVDQDALIRALSNRQILGAGIDVMYPEPLAANHPLMRLPNCVITPHLGTSTVRTTNDMAIIAALNVLTGLTGEPMYSPVP